MDIRCDWPKVLVEYRNDEDDDVSALSVDDQALNRLFGSVAGRIGRGVGRSLILTKDEGRGLLEVTEGV